MDQKLRIGIIGAGTIGKVHASYFQQQLDTEVAAIADVQLEAARQVAEQFQITTTHESIDALLQDKQIDAVVIAVPNLFHEALVIQALKEGKHVLIEKPLAIDLKSARNIVRAQKESGKVVMIPHQLRWDAASLAIKEQAATGALGQIYYAKTGWFRRKNIPGWGSWFTQQKLSGGGPLIDVGVHMLDLAIYLMGNPKPVSVFAAAYSEFGGKKKGIGTWGTPNWNGSFDVEDLASAMIRFDNGATLQLEVSWAAHTIAENNGSFLHLMGSEGGAALQGDTGKFLLEQFNRTADIDILPSSTAEDPRSLMIRHFTDCIQRNAEPITNAYSGFVNMAIIEAIYESAREGKLVEVDLGGVEG
ncbi:Gfo/Idh/MocA family protein [Paenibacillus sp. JDR-2]|uniref:Gfo/Idh/MocA family protein n=1 Tax=Paenibacillus sp. (strain JDR-2) TaxID=324057 RepID=UPI0001AAF8CA|nr:Gfo/Idh/MocA family oxidoreductase [Paenibacillus sp. JDR-2]ACT01193.1 oxidoreductase domain protein [Paenibacillus sp. JDR-2]